MEVKMSPRIKDTLRRKVNILNHESKQIGSGQTRDGKSECRHSRNQRTEMDWNG